MVKVIIGAIFIVISIFQQSIDMALFGFLWIIWGDLNRSMEQVAALVILLPSKIK